MYETHAVVEREVVTHLPVVLNVSFGVVVDRRGFDVLLRLSVGTEASNRRIRVPERRIELVRAGRVVLEIDDAKGVVVDLFRFVAVRVVETRLERVPSLDLREADRKILGRVDVEPTREAECRWRVGGVGHTAAPCKRGHLRHPRAIPERRPQAVERLDRVVSGVDHGGVREQERKVLQSRTGQAGQ